MTKNKESSPDVYYEMGKRDAIAEVLMRVREKGSCKEAILELAKLMPENPHAKWIIEKLEGNKNDDE